MPERSRSVNGDLQATIPHAEVAALRAQQRVVRTRLGFAVMLDPAFGPLIRRGRVAVQASARAREGAQLLIKALERFRRQPASRVLAAIHTDGAGIIQGANDLAARLLNVPLERLVGMALLHFVARRSTRAFRGMVKMLGYETAIAPADIAFRPRHGHPQPVRTSVARTGPNAYCWTLAG